MPFVVKFIYNYSIPNSEFHRVFFSILYNHMKKITIVVVTYNCSSLIKETLKSIVEQDYSYKQLIVIDGKSKDGTLEQLERFSAYIDVLVSEPDKGIFDAMNKSLQYVTGDYVIFMNAGDRFVNNHVVSDIFEGKKYDEDLICGDFFVQNDLGYLLRKANPIYLYNPSPKELVFKSQGICHQALFTKSSVLKEIKFDLRFPLGADYDTTAKVFYKGNHKLRSVGFPIAVFDDGNGGASHDCIIRILMERSDMFNYQKGFVFWIKAYKIHLTFKLKKIVEFMFPQYVRKRRSKKYIQKLPI